MFYGNTGEQRHSNQKILETSERKKRMSNQMKVELKTAEHYGCKPPHVSANDIVKK
jgi:hypothetical protein